MRRDQLPFQRILFVCVNKREAGQICCSQRDSEAIAAALKARVKALGFSRVVRVSKSGCQDLCAKGPNVMRFPGEIWYHGVTPEDVERIIDDTVTGLEAAPSPSVPSV